MYHTHFGFERSLFGDGIAADSAVFRTPRHDRLIEEFKLALGSPSSSIVLKGPAGVGKTTLTSAALRASSTRLAIAWLGGMATNSAELLELLLVELGVNTLRTTRIERLQLWRQFQGEMRATDSRLFIVVERTEDLSHEVLHALDQLTAPDAAGNSGANLVLLGHPGVENHLAAPLLDSLRQRIRLHAELEPFTEAALQDYLRHQVACVGGHFDRVFSPGTVAALHRYTRGVARLVNTLCESALEAAAAQHQSQLTAELVASTAVSQLKLAELTPAAPSQLAAAPPAKASASGVRGPESSSVPRPAQAAIPVPVPMSAAPAPSVPAAEKTARTPPAPPVAPAAPTPVTSVTPVAPALATLAAPAPKPELPAAKAAPVAAPKPIEVEYDGSATDVADVALADFPVLTDAVELPEHFAKRPALKPAAAAMPPPAPANLPSKPASRIETAYAAPRPPQAPAVSQPEPPAAQRAAAVLAAPPAAQPSALADPEEDDVLRQTQSMRAIAVAKSIDDLSDLDAETLFGDAGLDLVSAALASAAEWPDDELDAVAAAAAPAPRAEPEKKEAPPPADDPFDFFGLGEDAPLELIDDSAPLPSERAPKTAVR